MITKIKIEKVNCNKSKLVALAEITIDNIYTVRNIRIIDSIKGLFVAMPSYKIDDGYVEIFSIIDYEKKNDICNQVLAEYLLMQDGENNV